MKDKEFLGMMATAIGFWIVWEMFIFLISGGHAFVGAI